MALGYPILLNVGEKRIVIVGGGQVGLRKAVKIAEAGARDIVVVSPAFVDGFPAAVRKVAEEYRLAHLNGAALVFAATDLPAVNEQVVRDARARHILVNRADRDDAGDFSSPAVLREGPVTVAVSAESPALSAFIRDGLKHGWQRNWTDMADAMASLRPFILASGLAPARRRRLFRQLATQEAMDKLAAGGSEALRQWIMTEIDGPDDTQHD